MSLLLYHLSQNGLLESDVYEKLLTGYQQFLVAGTSRLTCLYGAIIGIAAFGLHVSCLLV